MSRFSYTITAIPADQGGGWVLKLFIDHQHTGGGYYPAPEPYPHVVNAWWRDLGDETRQAWLQRSGTDNFGAYRAYMLSRTFDQAEEDGQAWVNGCTSQRGKESV